MKNFVTVKELEEKLIYIDNLYKDISKQLNYLKNDIDNFSNS